MEDLIDTDGPRRRQPRPVDLLLHVERIQSLHRTVVQTFHLGHRLFGISRHSLPTCVAKRWV